MTEEKVLTGYPSIDKPWLKYYTNVDDEFRQEGLYEYLTKSNQDNLENTALMYFGRKITFKQMFKLIDKLSEVFIQDGIQPKDKVVLLGLNTPDIICSVYALNKIGAIVCIEYVSQKEISLGDITKQYGAKWAIVLDVFIEKYKDVLLESGVKKIFVSGLVDSMPIHLKTLYRLKQSNRNRNLSSQISELYTLPLIIYTFVFTEVIKFKSETAKKLWTIIPLSILSFLIVSFKLYLIVIFFSVSASYLKSIFPLASVVKV